MKLGLYPKIAADGIRKNGRLYVPYIGTCILMIAVFYIMHLLGYSDIVDTYIDSSTAKQMMQFGTYIMAVFGTIFLFYTQSALIKGRLKEFGLYSVLGMNKRNIGRIIFCENIITWFFSMAGGLVVGIGLSKLAELGFAKVIEAEISYRFNISVESVAITALVYSIIFFLIYLNALRQVRFTNTINLVNSDKAGEKPPKANWVIGIFGFILLFTGYAIAIKIEQPMSALLWFLIAVILIIIGTYLVLIAGSVLLCRILQKNKAYYYKTNHFVSVSSMAYRMKRNGASLASICILLTMVLVMISSTTALYVNREDSLKNHCPRQIDNWFGRNGFDPDYHEIAANILDGLETRTKEYGAAIDNSILIYDYSLAGYYEKNFLNIDIDPMESVTTLDYDKVAQVFFFDLEEYNRLTGGNNALTSGEALIGIEGNIRIDDELKVGNETFTVAGRFDPLASDIRYAIVSPVVSTIFVVVDDLDEVASRYADYTDSTGTKMLAWEWQYYYDVNLEEEQEIELSRILGSYLKEELKPLGGNIRSFSDSRADQRNDFVKTFGGLLFLGILLSAIFLVACVLIIYYKQISEGFEDQSRFGIMQKIGMTKDNIKNSINSQMLTVFLIPITFSCLHLATILPIIHKLLLLFGHNNMPLLITCAGICVLVCGIFYAVTYKLTSNAYYKIVS